MQCLHVAVSWIVKAVPGRSLVAGLLAGLILAAGCRDSNKKQGETKPVDVQVSIPVEAKDITDYEEFTGLLSAQLMVQLESRIDGFLEEASFKEGDIVKKDTPLFRIDAKPFMAKLNQAKADVKQAEAKLENARFDYERAKLLWHKMPPSIAKEQYDAAVGAKDVAEANLDSLKAAQQSAQLDVNYCTIKAPFDGKMSKRFVDPDNWVKSGTTVLSTIVSLNPIYAYFSIDEQTWLKVLYLSKAKNGDVKQVIKTVLVGLGDQAKDVFPYEGKLDFVDNQTDQGTGTVLVRGVFDTSKDPMARAMLQPGLFARIKLPIGDKHDALLISERALGPDQGQKFVYIINDQNETEYRRVKVGAMHKGLRMLEEPVYKDGKIVEGVLPGEKILVSGVQKVRPKQKVNPTMVDMPVGASSQHVQAGTPPDKNAKTPDGKSAAPH